MSDNNKGNNDHEYTHLDFRINTLYDAVYNKHATSQYIIKPIVKSNVSLIDIKEPDNFDYKHVFEGQIKYIGIYNSKWTFKRTVDTSHPCTISIGKYEKLGNINDLSRKELYNPAIHYILSETAINENFKHVMLPLMFFDVLLSDLKKLSPIIYDEIKDQVPDNAKLYCFVTEHYFKMETLSEFIKNEFSKMTPLHWKVLLFQILYTLHKFAERLQRFRHNMVNLDAIRLYRKKEGGTSLYKIGITAFEVPNMGFDIKITDFENSNAGDYLRNKDVTQTTDNPYYDVHYFICSLYLFVLKNFENIPHDIKSFIDEMVPARFLPNESEEFTGLNERDFDAVSSQIIVPAIVLKKNNFFNEFITSNMDLTTSPIQNERIKIKNLGKKENGIDYLSPTDDISEGPRMLARKVSENKKSKQYNNKNMTISGSRKIIVSSFDKTNSASESGIFQRAERKSSVMSRSKEDSVFDEKDIKRMKKAVKSKHSKKGGSTTSSDSESEKNRETIVLSDSSDKYKINVLENAKQIMDTLKELKESGKHKRNSKKHQKRSESSESDKHKRNSKKHQKRNESSESGSTSRSSRSSVSHNANKDLEKIDPAFATQMGKVAKNYFGEVPDHILAKLPPLEGSTMGMPQMMDPNMMMQQQMPQMMQQQMPQMIPQMDPSMMMQQQMQSQMMPPQMMQQQMMPSNMMGNSDMGLGLPMMPNMMPNMMGGGKKASGQSYCFLKDGNIVDSKKYNKDFFF